MADNEFDFNAPAAPSLTLDTAPAAPSICPVMALVEDIISL